MTYYYTLDDPQKGIILQHYVHDINRYRFNWHKDIEITFVLQGEIEFCIEGTTYFLEEDDLILVNSNKGHASLLKKPGSIAMVLRFDPTFLNPFFETNTNLQISCVSSGTNRWDEPFRKIRALAAKMLTSFAKVDFSSKLNVEGAFFLLCASLLSDFPQEKQIDAVRGSGKNHQRTIQSILDFIEQNYPRKISLDEIAKKSKYNRTYVSSFFKSNVGVSFYEYLIRVRLRHALHELNTTQKSLTEIALDSGFPDLKAFSTRFKLVFETSPSQYRLKVGNEGNFHSLENQRNYLPLGTGNVEQKLIEYQQKEHIDCSSLSSLINKTQPQDNLDRQEIKRLCNALLQIVQ